MQHQQNETPQVSPEKPPMMTHEVFVGYGSGSPRPNNRWKNWLVKIRAAVWPPVASPVRRLATVGTGAVFVVLVPLSIVLVSNNTVREFVTDTNGGQQADRQEGRGAAGPDGGADNPDENGENTNDQNPGSDEANGQNGNTGSGGNNGGNTGANSSGNNGGTGNGGNGNNSGGDNNGGGEEPASCAWPNFPNETCTGVPAGVTLTPSGSLTITTPGTVVDALLINGTVTIQASNVTIKRSRILPGNNQAVRVLSGNVIVEDVEIDGQLPNGGVTSNPASAVGNGNYTLRRVNIHHMYEGPRIGGNVTIEDSYIHHMSRCTLSGGSNCHIDTLQSTAGSNIIVRHNTILPYNDITDDPLNAAYIVKADTGNIDNVLIEKNYMNGGNYTVYVHSAAFTTSNVTVRDNRFGRDYRFGVKSISNPVNLVWENNAWADTGEIIP